MIPSIQIISAPRPNIQQRRRISIVFQFGLQETLTIPVDVPIRYFRGVPEIVRARKTDAKSMKGVAEQRNDTNVPQGL